MSKEATIIVLPTGYDPEGDDAPITRKRPMSGPCPHREVAIHTDANRLICRRCDEEIAPLAWITMLSHDWQWYQTRRAMAEKRAKDAEASAERRVREAQRTARIQTAIPMPLGRRLSRIAGQIGRAQGELAQAFASLAEVHTNGRAPMADHYLGAAVAEIERARSSLAKLIRDHAKDEAVSR